MFNVLLHRIHLYTFGYLIILLKINTILKEANLKIYHARNRSYENLYKNIIYGNHTVIPKLQQAKVLQSKIDRYL